MTLIIANMWFIAGSVYGSFLYTTIGLAWLSLSIAKTLLDVKLVAEIVKKDK